MKDMTKNEIANIIHVLAYLAKINYVVDPAEKKRLSKLYVKDLELKSLI